MITDCRNIKGTVEVPLSKSMLHRHLICAYLAGRGDVSEKFSGEGMPDDVIATARCIGALSACGDSGEADCRESAATLRMLMPLAAALGIETRFVMGESLAARPTDEIAEIFSGHGASAERKGNVIRVKGKLEPGEYKVPTDISSQYVSGLLMALPVTGEECRIVTDEKPHSEPYIEMTRRVMEAFGVRTERCDNGDSIAYIIPSGQKYVYTPECESLAEGDWTAAAIWLTADALLGGGIEVEGLNPDSVQGDRVITDILKKYKSIENWRSGEKTLQEKHGDKASVVSDKDELAISLGNNPDLVPVVALRAAASSISTRLTDISALRYKESDRIENTVRILSMLGADIHADGDDIVIKGSGRVETLDVPRRKQTEGILPGTDEVISAAGDHRLAMMVAIASVITERPVRIEDPGCVKKSYPEFWEDIKKLGGRVDQI